MSNRHIYIGWDAREAVPAATLAYSIIINSEKGIVSRIYPLKHKDLRQRGLFWREWRIDETGQMWDVQDGAPCSTEFSFTRFLVPELAKVEGKRGYALFMDCDMLVLDDINEAFEIAESDPSKAVWCVKHEHNPTETVKMDNIRQTNYLRKNWSSFMIFNLDHPDNQKLTKEAVNSQRGLALHGFYWTDAIGELPEKWNYLWYPNDKSRDLLNYSNIHFTAQNPWQHPSAYEEDPAGKLWEIYKLGMYSDLCNTPAFPAEKWHVLLDRFLGVG